MPYWKGTVVKPRTLHEQPVHSSSRLITSPISSGIRLARSRKIDIQSVDHFLKSILLIRLYNIHHYFHAYIYSRSGRRTGVLAQIA